MERLSEEEKKYLKYQIYSLRYEDPWIPNKKVARMLNRSITTVDRYAKEAEEEGAIWNPTLGVYHRDRKVTLLQFEDKLRAFNELQKYMNIGYVCVFQGGWDIMTVYDEEVDFSQIPGYERTVMKGLREKIFTSKVQYTSWESCFDKMEELLRKDFVEKSTIDYDPCYPDWDFYTISGLM